jgi:isoquinoline 1-oxidoreductase alpha subunit
MPVAFTLNGKPVSLDVEPDMPLLWAIRDTGLTGTKFGCGVAQCGACTVHLDGAPIRSCVTSVGDVADKAVLTIEAIGDSRVGKAVQEAWIAHQVPQCGYCQSGQIMSAAALLAANTTPGADDINAAMQGNICRCGTYNYIRAAIATAARELG